MKTKNYFRKAALLFLVGSAQFIMAQVPNYVPTNGLVAYYPFSGDANDASGNANNGTNNGATLTTDRFGNANSAYFFNGTTNYINVSSNNTLNFQTNNSFTLSYWINATSINTSKVNVIINKQIGAGTASQDGWNSNVEANRAINLRIQNAPSTVFCDPSSNAAAISNLTNYHITQVFQNGTSYVYINGIQVSTSTGCLGIIGDNSSNMFIGKPTWTSGNAQGFNGVIDDIGIWNRALTPAEITTMYNGVNFSDTCNAVSGSLVNGLQAYYPFCGNANDDSGNGNNGTVNGATLTTDRFGNVNSAYSLNGTSNYIALPSGNSTSLNITGNFTASFWIKTPDLSAALLTLGNNISSPYEGYLSGINAGFVGSGKLGVSTGGGVWTGSINTISDNNWHNITYVLNNNTLKIYLDNVLDIQTTVNNIPISWSGNRVIGCTNDLLLIPERLYNGIIDDIGIWNRALTQQEVTNLYNANQCFNNITVTDTLIINVGQLSYSNPITYANNIIITPNPASTQININFNNITNLNGGTLKIINSLGQQVATTQITTSGTQSIMQLSTWGGSGMYFVQIINPQGQIVDIKKIILQ